MNKNLIIFLTFILSYQIGYAQQPLVQQRSTEDFVELGMPLEEALTKITFMFPSLESGDLGGEIVFEGEGVTRKKGYIELHKPRVYTLLSKYAVESNQYIFVPLAQSGGGSGVFWALNVVDKKTLRTTDEVRLPDQARIEGMILAVPNSDIVSITYIERDVKRDLMYDPDKAVKRHFRMIEGRLQELGNPLTLADPGMVLIRAGEFQMGTNDAEAFHDEKPEHSVYVDAFYIDKYEVTVGAYKKFIQTTGHLAPDWREVAEDSPTDQHPIVHVSWYDAMAYAQWAGKRLPTEAEWEKAARGGLVGMKYTWGNSENSNKGNYNRNAGGTTPVGSYEANGYGLYDMAGNAWEWCLDEYDEDFYKNSLGQNPISGGTIGGIASNFWSIQTPRVLRGIAWTDTREPVRVSTRIGGNPGETSRLYGFRCVKPMIP